MVVTYGDLGRDPGGGGFRVSFGLVKEIASRGPSLEQTRLRELVAGGRRGCASRRRLAWHRIIHKLGWRTCPLLVVGSVSGGNWSAGAVSGVRGLSRR